jgi:hypothetical protein
MKEVCTKCKWAKGSNKKSANRRRNQKISAFQHAHDGTIYMPIYPDSAASPRLGMHHSFPSWRPYSSFFVVLLLLTKLGLVCLTGIQGGHAAFVNLLSITNTDGHTQQKFHLQYMLCPILYFRSIWYGCQPHTIFCMMNQAFVGHQHFLKYKVDDKHVYFPFMRLVRLFPAIPALVGALGYRPRERKPQRPRPGPARAWRLWPPCSHPGRRRYRSRLPAAASDHAGRNRRFP